MERPNAWKSYKKTDITKSEAIAEEYKRFIDLGKTERECVTETVAALEGVDIMVLNCLRERPHPTHMNYERSLAYLERIRPKKAYLIHMCHDLRHEDWLGKLPGWIEPAYDGLEVTP